MKNFKRVVKRLRVEVSRRVLDSIVTYALTLHPKEGVLLLRGRAEKDLIKVEDLVIPPFAVKGKGYSAIPLVYLPIDFSIVGTVHSHPSGNLNPSAEDLNNAYGRIVMIIAYPYRGLENLAAYTKDGIRLPVDVYS